jgi:type IV pilus assembly protein PilB
VLLRDASESAILAQARAQGMGTLRAAALEKARRGATTFEEVMRVSTADSAGGARCPACERKVEQDMVVCPWCATTLDRGHCQGCGRELDPDWRICPWCRTPAQVSKVPLSAPVAAVPAPSSAPPGG